MSERRHLVRPEFSDEAVWRNALGGAEPLAPFSTTGDISAPNYAAAGSMKSTKYGPLNTFACIDRS